MAAVFPVRGGVSELTGRRSECGVLDRLIDGVRAGESRALVVRSETKIYTRTDANPEARTVDYHCAWDHRSHLWMIYLIRVIDAQPVLDRPGSVVLWTNCHHPFYDHNPYPETAPAGRPVWVGDFWNTFGAGHLLELKNLKATAE
jgi:hypothetical protein